MVVVYEGSSRTVLVAVVVEERCNRNACMAVVLWYWWRKQ